MLAWREESAPVAVVEGYCESALFLVLALESAVVPVGVGVAYAHPLAHVHSLAKVAISLTNSAHTTRSPLRAHTPPPNKEEVRGGRNGVRDHHENRIIKISRRSATCRAFRAHDGPGGAAAAGALAFAGLRCETNADIVWLGVLQKKEGEGSKVYEIVEEDDEFEEFEDEGWMDRKEEEEEKHYWADDWDNDDINEEFAAQLRQELAATAK